MTWCETTIGGVAVVVTKGTTPTTYGMPFVDSGVNFVKAEALRGEISLDPSGFAYIDEATHEKLARSQLQEGDVLVTIAGANVGECGFVREVDLPANTNQAVGIVRVRKEMADPKFIYYFFMLPSTRATCQSIGSQAAQPNVNLANLKGFKVRLPDVPEQNRIVHILSGYDELIVNNRRRIELLEQSARLLFKEWFVHLRYPGHEHDKAVDGLPKGWNRKLLRDVAVTNSESFSARSLPPEINYIDISSVQSGRILQKTRMNAEDAPGRARRQVKDGDVIWSNVRPNLRQFALVIEPDEVDVVSTGFTTLTPMTIPSSFLYLAVTTDAFVAYLVNQTTGASYPAVRPDDFERAELVIPTPALLEDFSFQCEPMFRLADRLDAQNRKLVAARDLLLPRLMDSRVSV